MSKFCGFSNKVDSDIFAAETNIVIFRFQQETRKEHHCESGTAICQFIKITRSLLSFVLDKYLMSA